MLLTSFFEVMFNSVAQAKFVHTVSAGYVTAAFLSADQRYLTTSRSDGSLRQQAEGGTQKRRNPKKGGTRKYISGYI